MSDARDDEEIARAILQIVKTDVRRLKSSYHAAADSHGSLDRDGIMEWLPTFGLPMDITPAAAGEFYDLLIEEADANNDGLLQWGEFLLGLRKVGTKDQLRWSWATPGVESKSAETAFNPDAFALKLGQQQPSLAPAPALDSHRFNRALRAAGGAVDGAASRSARGRRRRRRLVHRRRRDGRRWVDAVPGLARAEWGTYERWEDGTEEPLADGWAEAVDPSTGAVYFFHVKSQRTQWELPLPRRALCWRLLRALRRCAADYGSCCRRYAPSLLLLLLLLLLASSALAAIAQAFLAAPPPHMVLLGVTSQPPSPPPSPPSPPPPPAPPPTGSSSTSGRRRRLRRSASRLRALGRPPPSPAAAAAPADAEPAAAVPAGRPAPRVPAPRAR